MTSEYLLEVSCNLRTALAFLWTITDGAITRRLIAMLIADSQALLSCAERGTRMLSCICGVPAALQSAILRWLARAYWTASPLQDFPSYHHLPRQHLNDGGQVIAKYGPI